MGFSFTGSTSSTMGFCFHIHIQSQLPHKGPTAKYHHSRASVCKSAGHAFGRVLPHTDSLIPLRAVLHSCLEVPLLMFSALMGKLGPSPCAGALDRLRKPKESCLTIGKRHELTFSLFPFVLFFLYTEVMNCVTLGTLGRHLGSRQGLT